MNAKVTVAAIFEEDDGSNPDMALPSPPDVDRTNCTVCGDKASGFHYGVYSCEGCKGFFRRSVNRGYVKACRWGNKCSMDLHSRRRCPDCRLRSCKAAGMRPDCLLTQAQCRSKIMWRQHQASKSAKGGSTGTSPQSSKSEASNQSVEEHNTFPTFTEIANTVNNSLQLSDTGNAVPEVRPFTSESTDDSSSGGLLFEELMSSFDDLTQSNPTLARSDSASEDMLSFFALLDNDSELFSEPTAVNGISTFQSAMAQVAVVAPVQAYDASADTQTLLSLQTGQNSSVIEVPIVSSPSSTVSSSDLTTMVKPEPPTISEIPGNDDMLVEDEVSVVVSQENATDAGNTDKIFARPDVPEHLAPGHQSIIAEILEYWKSNADIEKKYLQKAYEDSLGDGTLEEKRMKTIKGEELAVRRYVAFCKSLRGFDDLCIEDQIAVIKGSIFECGVMQYAACTHEFGVDKTRQVGLIWYTNEFVNMVIDWYHGMKKMNVDIMTLNILCCIIVLSPDRPKIKDRATLETAQQQYMDCLQAYCKVSYPDQPLVFARLMGKLTEVRTVGRACEEGLRPECRTVINTQPTLSEIYSKD